MSQTDSHPPKTEAELALASEARLDSPEAAALSQWQLIKIGFYKHRLAVISLFVLGVLYFVALFAEFFAPYSKDRYDVSHTYSPPQRIAFSFERGLHSFEMEQRIDPLTFQRSYVEQTGKPLPLSFLAPGEPYELWGFIPLRHHFFGLDYEEFKEMHPDREDVPSFNFLGSDKLGQDIVSRLIYGSRISLSIGLIAIAITFVLGLLMGGISGYVGGRVDNVIQRAIEIINSFPHLPLWLAFAAILPPDWSPIRIYFAITIVLSLLNWTGLARVTRGKILSLREEDYAVAARLLGSSHARIIFRHLMPGFASHIIVTLTLSIPGMILGETALSFLGLGLRPPVVSWGVMLQDCMSPQSIIDYPWLLMPLIMIVVTVLSFNFLGDGLRDAADPYSKR